MTQVLLKKTIMNPGKWVNGKWIEPEWVEVQAVLTRQGNGWHERLLPNPETDRLLTEAGF